MDKEDKERKENLPKLKYSENQWSPLNPEGKKRYDKEFLVHLQSAPMSLIKPCNLPNLDIIKDKAHLQKISMPMPKSKEELIELNQLKKSIKGILNKITHLNFKVLLMQFENLNINTQEKWNIIVKGVFNQAMFDELNYCDLYVNFYQHFKKVKGFLQFILDKSLDELDTTKFKRPNYYVSDMSCCIQDVCFGKPNSKKRRIAVVRFVGKLFKEGFFDDRHIISHIKKLLSENDENSLECLCCLLKIVGKTLEINKRKGYKNWVSDLKSRKDSIKSARIRFMLQDLLELEEHNWTPRNQEQDLKNQHEALSSVLIEAVPENNKINNTAQNVISKENLMSLDNIYNCAENSNKLKLSEFSKNSKIEMNSSNEIKDCGSESNKEIKNYSSSSDHVKPYSIISLESNEGNTNQISSNSTKTLSQSKESCNIEKKAATDAAIPKTSTKKQKKKETLLGSKIKKEKKLKKLTELLIEAFLFHNDFEETVKRITHLISNQTAHIFISYSINLVLKRSSQERQSVSQLLSYLVKQHIITIDHYNAGLVKFMESIDNNFASDVYLVWDYLGEILEPLLDYKNNSLSVLKKLIPFIPPDKAGRFVSATLHYASKKRGTLELANLWKNSGLQWEVLLGKEANVNEFILKNKLECITPLAESNANTPLLTKESKEYLFSLLKKHEENGSCYSGMQYQIPNNNHSQKPVMINPAAQQTELQYNMMHLQPPFFNVHPFSQVHPQKLPTAFQGHNFPVPTKQVFFNNHSNSYNSFSQYKALHESSTYKPLSLVTNLSQQTPKISTENACPDFGFDSKECNLKELNYHEEKKFINISEKKHKNISVEKIPIDPKYHYHFVVRNGEVLKQIADEFGGVSVRFPKKGSSSDEVTLIGVKECVKGAKARLLEIAQDLEMQDKIYKQNVTIGELRNSFISKEEELRKYKESLCDYKKKVEKCQLDMREKQLHLCQQKEKIEELVQDIYVKNQHLSKLQEEFNMQHNQMKKLESDLVDFKGDLSKKEGFCINLEEDISKANEVITKLQQEMRLLQIERYQKQRVK